MGFFDELRKLTRPYDEDEDDYFDEAEAVEEPAPPPPKPNPFSNFNAERAASQPPAEKRAPRASRPKEGRVVNLGAAGGSQTQVVLVTPQQFETAAEIADHLRSNRAVLMNLESTPKDLTRRLVDFLSGVTYAIDGSIRRVSTSTYIMTPPNVGLMGDQVDGLESNGIYF